MEPAAEPTAEIVAQFVEQARERLTEKLPANDLLLRGFAQSPTLPSLHQRFAMHGMAIAVYPDYKGISRLAGMDVIENLSGMDEQLAALSQAWSGEHRFFFIHHKETDSAGEDGDFDAKVAEIERVDTALPGILSLNPDVLIITGDHSTPATVRTHTEHPVPFLIHSAACRPDTVRLFGERTCATGSWGVIPATALLPIATGYAGKRRRFGA